MLLSVVFERGGIMYRKVVILGLGKQTSKGTDICVCVINYLKNNKSIKNAQIIANEETASDLLDSIESTDQLIVVDTIELKLKPGDIKIFEGFEMDALISSGKHKAVHDDDLRNALNLAMADGKLPSHRALVGIQPGKYAWGNEENKHLALSIPKACQKIFEITENWKV